MARKECPRFRDVGITQALHNLQQGDSNAAGKTLIGATIGLERGKTS